MAQRITPSSGSRVTGEPIDAAAIVAQHRPERDRAALLAGARRARGLLLDGGRAPRGVRVGRGRKLRAGGLRVAAGRREEGAARVDGGGGGETGDRERFVL